MEHPLPPEKPATPVEPAAPAEMEVQNYRLQLMASDALSFGLGFAHPALFGAGYLLGAPSIHLAHGNYGRALGSLGLRLGMRMVGLGLGFLIGGVECGGSICGAPGAGPGLLLGMGTALVIDWVYLGKKETPVEQPALIQAGGVAANPTFAVGREGSVSLGLRGTF